MARLSLLLSGGFLSHYVIKTSVAPFLLCWQKCTDLCFCMYQVIWSSMRKKSEISMCPLAWLVMAFMWAEKVQWQRKTDYFLSWYAMAVHSSVLNCCQICLLWSWKQLFKDQQPKEWAQKYKPWNMEGKKTG